MLCLVFATAIFHVSDAQAQFEDVWVPDQVYQESTFVLYAEWAGEEEADGLVVTLPPGWELQDASAVTPDGDVASLSFTSEGNDADVAGLPSGPSTIILHIETGSLLGTENWSLTPYANDGEQTLLEEHSVLSNALVEEVVPGVGRQVLSFAEEDAMRGEPALVEPETSEEAGAAIRLRGDRLPDLSGDAAYTVAFWLQARNGNEMLFSTWDGDEAAAYPLEVMIDRWGHVRFYRGEPGHHQSMITEQPAADGQWHHIAVVHDPESGWTRLLQDGLPADSLYSAEPLDIPFETPLSIGARLGEERPHEPFSGRVGAIHLWPDALTDEEVRSRMRRSRATTREYDDHQPVFIEFDEPLSEELVEEAERGGRRVASPLVVENPLEHLQARLEDEGVRLTWEAQGHATEAFVVERSSDGVHFEPVGRVPVTPGIRDDAEVTDFSFVDEDVHEQVLYYRVQQRFQEGAEHLSGAIKIGLGASEEEQEASLVGNFPNPFHDETVIAFELFQRDHVRLSVWDVTGQQVALLLDESTNPGYHEVSFDGRDLRSGTYFVRLETADEEMTHSMILTR